LNIDATVDMKQMVM